ncbi:MAG: hypothetical protein LAQ30_24660 [Acidobacteriia bacterium]|nr:hypothetical protein [Terriglobia bacterium]
MASEKPHRCPSCGNREARPSQMRRPVMDSVMQLLRLAPYRCRVCGLRFYEQEEANPRETPMARSGAAGGGH